ncbi:homing endonuclease [Escherichia phage T4]|nr:homing endonuclease [Escherichia phage T4]UJD20276.1 homing endonuclease [Escherichia phage T4]
MQLNKKCLNLRGITQKRNVPVFQYDTTGKLLRVFPRIKDAAVSVKGCMSNIKKCNLEKAKLLMDMFGPIRSVL